MLPTKEGNKLKKFFIGTTNPNKIREIGGILRSTGCEFEPIGTVDPEETEDNFEGNAIIKALAYAKASRGITISEDSGILIPSLNNLPGPWSARFSDCKLEKENGIYRILEYHESALSREDIDRKNNELVLDLMKDVPFSKRVAKFCVILIVANERGNILFKASGESTGWISTEMHGMNGFGYDPIFVGGDTHGKTYAELDNMRKNLRSHRKKVLDEFKAWLGFYLKK